MSEEIKVKVNVPLFEEKELEIFDNNIHSIIEEYSKLHLEKKDQILTQRIIKKQEEEINRLNNIINKAVEYIETLEKQEAYKIEDNENGVPELKVDNEEYFVFCKYNKLLNILQGSDKE